MDDIIKRIKKDSEGRVLRNNDGNQDFLAYLDRNKFKKGDAIDIVTQKIDFDKPTYLVFVDDEPGKNFGHRCHYLLYDADTGEFIRKIPASFPHFLIKRPDSLEVFHESETTSRYKRKKKIRMILEPARLSAYTKLAPFPLKFRIRGRRYAILYSGASNGRHVNDLEFMYRTLVDVYGYDTADIYVLNYDGTLNYNRAVWSNGWTEPPASDGFGPDGSAWRMDADGRIVGQGTRAGFQNVISDLANRIGSYDCLLIHTNNHGWTDANGGFMSAYNGIYYASDFATDLAQLPAFKTLLVVMEQCRSGSFAQPVLNSSTASKTVFQAAVPDNESSAGGWPFDPWAEMWISAMAGVRGDGSALALSPDDNLNNLISAWEAYDYAINIDDPVMSESSPGLSENVYLCRCLTTVKMIKEWKEWKEPKEFKEYKELKEIEPKIYLEPKLAMEPKAYEGVDLIAQYQWQIEELRERFDRLEDVINKLEPFITKEERPSLKPKPRAKRKT